jgi:hypothetical protein
VELEPIGPLETLSQGQEASFTEHWTLHAHAFPAPGEDVDLARVKGVVAALPSL